MNCGDRLQLETSSSSRWMPYPLARKVPSSSAVRPFGETWCGGQLVDPNLCFWYCPIWVLHSVRCGCRRWLRLRCSRSGQYQKWRVGLCLLIFIARVCLSNICVGTTTCVPKYHGESIWIERLCVLLSNLLFDSLCVFSRCSETNFHQSTRNILDMWYAFDWFIGS